MSARPRNDCSPAVRAAEGLSTGLEADAGKAYRGDGAVGKRALGARAALGWSLSSQTAFRSPAGQVWLYSGKRARVLAMLATSRSGVTQWDTLPWHTRLGGTIHVLREDGLSIETVREGEYRHARYWLRTPGTLDDGREA